MGRLESKKVKVCTVLCEPNIDNHKEGRWFMETLASKTGGQAVGLRDGKYLADFIKTKVKTDIKRSCLEWQIQEMAAGFKSGMPEEEKAKRMAKVFKKVDVKMSRVTIDGTETDETSTSATTITSEVSTKDKELTVKDILKIMRRAKTGTSKKSVRTRKTGTSEKSGRTGKTGTSDKSGRSTRKTGTSDKSGRSTKKTGTSDKSRRPRKSRSSTRR
jgi:hypothetical protein